MRLTPAIWNRLRDERGIYIQVLLDSSDVTYRCTFADDEAGEVILVDLLPLGKRNPLRRKGKDHQIVQRVHKGKVQFVSHNDSTSLERAIREVLEGQKNGKEGDKAIIQTTVTENP